MFCISPVYALNGLGDFIFFFFSFLRPDVLKKHSGSPSTHPHSISGGSVAPGSARGTPERPHAARRETSKEARETPRRRAGNCVHTIRRSRTKEMREKCFLLNKNAVVIQVFSIVQSSFQLSLSFLHLHSFLSCISLAPLSSSYALYCVILTSLLLHFFYNSSTLLQALEKERKAQRDAQLEADRRARLKAKKEKKAAEKAEALRKEAEDLEAASGQLKGLKLRPSTGGSGARVKFGGKDGSGGGDGASLSAPPPASANSELAAKLARRRAE